MVENLRSYFECGGLLQGELRGQGMTRIEGGYGCMLKSIENIKNPVS